MMGLKIAICCRIDVVQIAPSRAAAMGWSILVRIATTVTIRWEMVATGVSKGGYLLFWGNQPVLCIEVSFGVGGMQSPGSIRLDLARFGSRKGSTQVRAR